MNKLDNIDFYFITDSKLSKKGIFSDVENAVNAGCQVVQYRVVSKKNGDMVKEAEQLKKICYGRAVFLVDDRVDVALAVDADGVHIGQGDIPLKTARKLLGKEKIIGQTVHDLEEAIKAEKLEGDYIGLAPIFKTDTKEDARDPCGTEMIKKVRKEVSLPIVAVGGIDKNNVSAVIQAGADSAVSINAVVCSDDVYAEVSDFIRIIRRCKSR